MGEAFMKYYKNSKYYYSVAYMNIPLPLDCCFAFLRSWFAILRLEIPIFFSNYLHIGSNEYRSGGSKSYLGNKPPEHLIASCGSLQW